MKSPSWLTPEGFLAICAVNTTEVTGERERLADYTETVTEVPSGTGWPKLSRDLQECWEHLLRECWSIDAMMTNAETLYPRERLTPESWVQVRGEVYRMTLTYDRLARDTRAQLAHARAEISG